MDEHFIGDRITALRMQKGVSEYQMSIDLGHSGSYVRSISSYRALPSMKEFIYICEYFGITPSDFFDSENENPCEVSEVTQKLKKLRKGDLELLIGIIDRFADGFQ